VETSEPPVTNVTRD